LLVDAVTEVLTIKPDRLEEPPSFFAGASTRYLESVAKIDEERLVLLVDVERLFSEAEEEMLGKLSEE
ncbi:MAG: chemotaxis protein CheW, partial [Gemmatimonadota bacterium]|nr:chemotaxis protein CheW [Gemmatimonadota bacterium]